MGERNKVLGELYVLWVEAHVLQCGLQGNQEVVSVGSDPRVATDPNSIDTSNLPSSVASPEGQLGGIPMDEPTGDSPTEGVWTNEEVAQVAVASEEGSFDPQQF